MFPNTLCGDGQFSILYYLLVSHLNAIIIKQYPESNLQPGQQSTVRHLLYLWTGRQCPLEVRACGETLTTELFQHLQRNVMQIRVNDGLEPPHFLQIFKGKLIVFNGQCTDYDPTGSCNMQPSTFLLKVTGDSTFNSKAVQISNKSAFGSKDCLILMTLDKEVWVWCGQGSTGDSREIAKSIGSTIGEYTLALESNEPIEFWMCLPEKIEAKFRNANQYLNGIAHSTAIANQHVDLYICLPEHIDETAFERVCAFEQLDLTPEDVYLLDVGSFVYVWVGALT